jgi:hypothetical protein
MSTLREESTRDWTGSGSIDHIKAGCLQRIADATEKMAKVMYESHTRHSWQNVWNTHKGLLAMDVYRADADALIKYLTE